MVGRSRFRSPRRPRRRHWRRRPSRPASPECRSTANDVFAVREVVSEALETARRGGGPCLIEALTYRLSDHTTADDASRYRSATEVEAAWAVEPLLRLRTYLRKQGVWNDAKEQALLQDCALEVDTAVAEYLRFAKPSTDAMFDHLFAALPKALARAARDRALLFVFFERGSSSSKLDSSKSRRAENQRSLNCRK